MVDRPRLNGRRRGVGGRTTFVWADPSMDRVRRRIAKLGPTECSVLLHGETGTGKELAARAIHAASARRDGPFIPVDCAALPESLAESQLFGHVRGAFTGAETPAVGFIRAADGGALFLDEIGELPSTSQARLLRCIQERVVTPVGSVEPVPVDIRVISATHRDLVAMSAADHFREDLLYRLEVATIELPPLRERPADIPVLIEHFLARFAARYERSAHRVSPAALDAMLRYGWPGNVRQLSNAIEHAVIFCEGPELGVDDLPRRIARPGPGADGEADGEAGVQTLAESERRLIARALRIAGGNQSRAARLVEVERHRFRRMVQRHGLASLTAGATGTS